MGRESVAPIIVGVTLGTLAVGGLAGVLWWRSRQPAAPPGEAPAPRPRPPSSQRRPAPLPRRPGATGPEYLAALTDELDPQEVDALAHMFASEDRRRNVRIVIGWIAVQVARRRGISLHRLLTGTSGQYGPQQHGGEVRYASTAKDPDGPTRVLAGQVLSGELLPSSALRAMGPGAWVEEGVGGYDGRKILSRQLHQRGPKKGQRDFGGIWGRLAGTKWVLYNGKAPVLVPDDETEEAAQRALAQLPEVPATDGAEPPAIA